MSVRRAVYSAIIGRYESLTEQPIARESEVPFICLTDDPDLTSETWTIELVEPTFPFDPIRSARRLKILGNERLAQFTETLWIDNRIRLLERPELILEDWLADADIAMPTHSARLDLLDEFRAVIEGGYDEPGRVQEQLSHYAQSDPELLLRKPLWTAILARRRSDAVHATMRHWYDDVLRYSRRDQLSVLAALAATGVAVETRDLENDGSPLHQWLSHRYVRRQTDPAYHVISNPLAPAVFRVRDLEVKLAEASSARARLDSEIHAVSEQRNDLLVSLSAREKLLTTQEAVLVERDKAIGARDDVISARDHELVSRAETIDNLHREVVAHAGTINDLHSEVVARDSRIAELLSSSSWRVTAPFRAMTRIVRRLRGQRADQGETPRVIA